MDAREKVMFEEHDDLLDKRQTLAQEKTRLERQIEAEESGLKIDLQELLKADNVGISELELEVIRGKTQTMKDLRADEINKLNVSSLRITYELAVQEDADAVAKEKSLAEQIEAASAHIKKREERPLSVYERFAGMCDRQTDDCPAKLKIANQQVPTPDLDDVVELKTELEEHRKRLADVQGSKSKLREALEKHRGALSEAEKQVSSLTAGIDGQIALYEAMEKRVDRQIGRMNRFAKATKRTR
jgi:hypothetical protein